MSKQELGPDGQPIFSTDKLCPHGIRQDDRGNSGCEECRVDDHGESHQLGVVSGNEDIARAIRKRAGEFFATKDDRAAKLLRDLADEIWEWAVAERKKFDDRVRERETKTVAQMDIEWGECSAGDPRFIEHAWQDVFALLAEVRRLRGGP